LRIRRGRGLASLKSPDVFESAGDDVNRLGHGSPIFSGYKPGATRARPRGSDLAGPQVAPLA
jgi:hypothetical protein